MNETEALHVSFYKAEVLFARFFAAIAQVLSDAGPSDADADALRQEVELPVEMRAATKRHWGEELHIKSCEADTLPAGNRHSSTRNWCAAKGW